MRLDDIDSSASAKKIIDQIYDMHIAEAPYLGHLY